MSAYTDLLNSDIRLVMLRCMAEDTGYSLNESILESALEMYGHKVSRDQVRTQMMWLKEQGLIEIEEVAGIFVATLTGRGLDCAQGKCRVPGVKAPRPRG